METNTLYLLWIICKSLAVVVILLLLWWPVMPSWSNISLINGLSRWNEIYLTDHTRNYAIKTLQLIGVRTRSDCLVSQRFTHTQIHTLSGHSWCADTTGQGADRVESGRPAFFLSLFCHCLVLPHGLPALSTLLHTAGIQPINSKKNFLFCLWAINNTW